MTIDDLRTIASRFDGVEEGTSYGTPAWRHRRRFLGRMWEDGTTLVLKVDPIEREALMQADPETYFLTDHYRGYDLVLIRLPTADPQEVAELFDAAYSGR